MIEKDFSDILNEHHYKTNKERLAERTKKAMELEKDPEKLKKAINDDITKRLMMGEDYFKCES